MVDTTIISLPTELLQDIFELVRDKDSLLALSTSCKGLRSHLFLRLFSVVTIKSLDEFLLWDFASHPHFSQFLAPKVPRVFRAVRELAFKAPFEDTRPMLRCKHSTVTYSEQGNITTFVSVDEVRASQDSALAVLATQKDPEMFAAFDSGDDDYDLIILSMKMFAILSGLKDNQLTAFSWDLGTCFPSAILGKGGYLVAHQNSIRKLSLTTESSCLNQTPPLSKFSNLRELSWRGVLSADNCSALKDFLEHYHQQVTALELDFMDWTEMESLHSLSIDDNGEDGIDKDDQHVLLGDLILPPRKDEYEGFLPNLQKLSLSASSLRGSCRALANAFNLQNVKELRIRCCIHALELLNYCIRSKIVLRAVKVELVLAERHLDNDEFEMVDFLDAFNNLKDLFVLFPSDYADSFYVRQLPVFRDTLRRLVFHGRYYCMDGDSPDFRTYCDNSADKYDEGRLAELLCETELECFGVCAEPYWLHEALHGIGPRVSSLRLLHLRFTGKVKQRLRFYENPPSDAPLGTYRPPGYRDMDFDFTTIWGLTGGGDWATYEGRGLEYFANWAFGRHGFPNLEVLVTGDFSHGKRFGETQTLWCRQTDETRYRRAYRQVTSADFDQNELIDANMDMLSACPASPLLIKHGNQHIFPGLI